MENLIFLVEDDDDVRSSYGYVLEPVGKVVAFSNAAEFLNHLDKFPEEKPDLVITDLSMPQMTGVEMIAAAGAKGARFPAILISGFVSKESAIDAVNTGICMILEKPVEGNQLIATVKQLLLTREIEKVRNEMLQAVEQMRELLTMFRDMCVDELELRSVTDPEAVLDDAGGSRSSINSSLQEIEERLANLKDHEKKALEKITTAIGKTKVSKVS